MNRITLDISGHVGAEGTAIDFTVKDNYVFDSLMYAGETPVVCWVCHENNTHIAIEPLTGRVVVPPAHWGPTYRVLTPLITLQLATLEALISRCERTSEYFRLYTDIYSTKSYIGYLPGQPAEIQTNEKFAKLWIPVVESLARIVKGPTSRQSALFSHGRFLDGYYFVLKLDDPEFIGTLPEDRRTALIYAEDSSELMSAAREILCFGSHHTRLGDFSQYTAHVQLVEVLTEQLGWMAVGNSRKVVIDKSGSRWDCVQTLDASVRHITFMCSRTIQVTEQRVFSGNATLCVTVPLFDTTPVNDLLDLLLDSITP